MKSIPMDLKVKNSYEVLFKNDLLQHPLFLIEKIRLWRKNSTARCLFIVESKVSSLWPIENLISQLLSAGVDILGKKPLIMDGGEECKQGLDTFLQTQKALNDLKADRQTLAFTIGGGAFLDAIGFACSTLHRGMDIVRIPTTLLAQNDAGVGVKNGINLFDQKNFLGQFSPPLAVINDIQFVRTTTQRHKISSFAEALKVAFIKNSEYFHWMLENAQLIKNFHSETLEEMTYQCAKIHMEHIQNGADPFEKGSSRPLDFGHWIAHELEVLSNHRLFHGEAVAIGCMMDLYYSNKKVGLSKEELNNSLSLFNRLGFSFKNLMSLIPPLDEKKLNQALEKFSHHIGGSLTISLVPKIGSYIEVNEIETSVYMDALYWLNQQSLDSSKEVVFNQKERDL